jgi:hypothetical protein
MAPLRRRPNNYPPTLQQAHRRSQRAKLTGRAYGTLTAAALIESLNSNRVGLLPFTVDHLGGLGYLAHCFLFDPDRAPTPRPPHLSFTPQDFTHPHANTAYSALLKAPAHLLAHANKEWALSAVSRFGETHHTATPQRWATQCLGLNLSTALSTHVLRAISTCVSSLTYYDC